MSLKLYHTSDVHIGMRFMHYPQDVQEALIEARFTVLETMVSQADQAGCQLFVVAGDLFEKQNVSRRDVLRTRQILSGFGGTVCLLPGNHDYISESSELWKMFAEGMPDNMIILGEEGPVELEEGDARIIFWPAPCHTKHSQENNLGWLAGRTPDQGTFTIGVAHGALEGLSPDGDGRYFSMSVGELSGIPADLWLLGHTHLPWPAEPSVRDHRIFNAGTPEPDGMDCRHEGGAWVIDIDDNRRVQAERVSTGQYRFADREETVRSREDLDRIVESVLGQSPEKTLTRLSLSGYVDEGLYGQRQAFIRELAEATMYLDVRDEDLRVRFTPERIRQEFSEGSLPAILLAELMDTHGEDTAHLAYEIIREVKHDAN